MNLNEKRFKPLTGKRDQLSLRDRFKGLELTITPPPARPGSARGHGPRGSRTPWRGGVAAGDRQAWHNDGTMAA
ncbi:MAG: hypothetical protein WBG44_03120 [Comamonas sp.]